MPACLLPKALTRLYTTAAQEGQERYLKVLSCEIIQTDEADRRLTTATAAVLQALRGLSPHQAINQLVALGRVSPVDARSICSSWGTLHSPNKSALKVTVR